MTQHYDTYYGDARLTQWRELGARDKVANVIGMWAKISKDPPRSIADIGCGDGAIIRELYRQGFGSSCIGIEVSESGIAMAKQQLCVKPTSFVLFDGNHLPFQDKSFDLAVLSHVLEHVELPRQLLREAGRVATYVFAEVPLELNARTPPDFQWTGTGHINLYNPLLLRHLVQSCGLHVVAERVTCPRRAVFAFRYLGWRGNLRWIVKSLGIRLCHTLAPRMWTYHGCLIAQASFRQAFQNGVSQRRD